MFKKSQSFMLLTFLGIVILGKLWYRQAVAHSLSFILKPTSFLVSTFIDAESILHNGAYYYSEWNIIIDKSCSGFNFALMSWILISGMITHYSFSKWKTFGMLLSTIPIVWMITIIVNTMRIVCSIQALTMFQNVFSKENLEVLHQSIGTFIYLTMLCVSFISIHYFITKFKNYASI